MMPARAAAGAEGASEGGGGGGVYWRRRAEAQAQGRPPRLHSSCSARTELQDELEFPAPCSPLCGRVHPGG